MAHWRTAKHTSEKGGGRCFSAGSGDAEGEVEGVVEQRNSSRHFSSEYRLDIKSGVNKIKSTHALHVFLNLILTISGVLKQQWRNQERKETQNEFADTLSHRKRRKLRQIFLE
ncbi:hypothetical protein NPIL_357721 [Nephila pilipes]|uniref:Uncharacterized protein n=1 Tax=Nephila pilipes TaxID=299642 RepID=A0A8X6TMI9_NEPPI|nr:hypothetical protein NPIL_357721 [Nephila pilipes]